MRAISQATLGGPEVLQLVEAPRPEPAMTEVLVRVRAAGINPVDLAVRERGGILGEPPFTVGWDIAGVVEEVGYGVTRFAVGDRVFGMPRFPGQAAAYAEYVTSPSRQLARTPDALTDAEAGALPLAALTAWQALVETADVGPGQRVLVHGAAGGVGHIAVQIAKARGAYVIGTARRERHASLAELGVDEAIDYTERPFEEVVGDVDAVLDLVAGDTAVRSIATLRDGGILLVLRGEADDDALQSASAGRVRIARVLVEPDRAGLEAIAALVDQGELRPTVAETYPLTDAARAHADAAGGHAQGKRVLLVGEAAS